MRDIAELYFWNADPNDYSSADGLLLNPSVFAFEPGLLVILFHVFIGFYASKVGPILHTESLRIERSCGTVAGLFYSYDCH